MDHYLEWSNSYSVGVAVIDKQHQYLISLIRELQDAMEEGNAREHLRPIVEKLATYTRYHFECEENFLSEVGSPAFAGLKKAHDRMTHEVAEFEKKVLDGQLKTGSPLMVYLRQWLLGHIIGEDIPAFRRGNPSSNGAPGTEAPLAEKSPENS